MRFGLAARLAVIFGALVFVTALLVTVASVLITSDQVHDDIDRFLRDRAEEILGGQREGPSRDDRRRGTGAPEDELAEAVESVDNPGAVDADSEVQSLDVGGEITARIGVTLPVEDIDRELAAEPGKAVYRTVTIEGAEYRMFTAHVSGGGALQVARDLEPTNDLLAEIRSMLLVLGAVLAVLGAVVGWFFARRTTRPLRSLTTSVEQVARTQDLSTPIGLDRSDEIGRLADSFDEMLAALAVSQGPQHQLVQDAAHELRTPLTSINANVELLERAPTSTPRYARRSSRRPGPSSTSCGPSSPRSSSWPPMRATPPPIASSTWPRSPGARSTRSVPVAAGRSRSSRRGRPWSATRSRSIGRLPIS